MRFEKDGLVIENHNPVCDELYLKRGWKSVADDEDQIDIDATTSNDVDDKNGSSKTYKKGDFTTLSIENIKALAVSLGYNITTTKKADIIEEFLTQQH